MSQPDPCQHQGPPAGVRIERIYDLDDARARTWQAGLFINDEASSHILEMVRAHELPLQDRWPVLAAWLAVDVPSGRDVGVILVSPNPLDRDDPLPVLNVYVHPDHQGRRIGSSLVALAHDAFPQARANYNLDAVRIYRRAGIMPVNIPRSGNKLPSSSHVDLLIKDLLVEREQFDAMTARYLARRPRR